MLLLNWFSNLNISQKPFSIQLKDFGSFPNSKAPVFYINPVSTEELSFRQVKIILSFISNISDFVNKTDIGFKPHITMAYRDLTSEMFAKAWQEYQHKKFASLFEVDAFYLLQHDSKKWNIIATYSLTHEMVSL